jgi:hypothetical protein
MIVKTPVPAIEGFCGPYLKIYQTQIAPSQILGLIGHDPTDWKKLAEEAPDIAAIYEAIQRKTKAERRDAIAEYMRTRMTSTATTPGAFPAICVGMFEPQEFTSAGNGMGFLQLDFFDKHKGLVLDGLGRVSGLCQLLKERIDVNAMLTFPVTIFTPVPDTGLSKKALGLLFHDFNYLAQPVTAQHALALAADGGSDPYLKLTSALAKKPVIADRGGMEFRAGSVGKNSTALVVQQVLMRFVRGACEGMKFQEANLGHVEHPNLTEETYPQVLANLESYLDGIAQRMGPRFKEKESVHLTAPGWQALGLIFHDFTYQLDAEHATPQRYKQILDAIANVDWSRHNPEWIGLLGEAELNRRTGVPVVDARGRQRVALSRAGRTSRAALYTYLLKRTGLDQLLAAQATVAA